MQRVRIGIVGLGNMGGVHAAQILAGKVPRLELSAVCDIDAKKLKRFEQEHPALAWFADSAEMIRSGTTCFVSIERDDEWMRQLGEGGGDGRVAVGGAEHGDSAVAGGRGR